MTLTVRRAADRAKMAALLVEEMLRVGAKAEIEPGPLGPREVWVKIEAPGGAHITVDFDGDSSQPDVYVVTWNTRGMVFLNPDIGSVNAHHYGKATRVCEGFESLLLDLKRDVARFIDGSGYLSLNDPRIVAMGESYKARGWDWPLNKE